MSTYNETYKKGAQLSLAALAVLTLYALIFYKERSLLTDAGHIIFEVINNRFFVVPCYRVGTGITQVLPVLAINLKLPIIVPLITYSLSFYLFYFIIALILYRRFRAYPFVILMGFYYLLMTTEGFFCSNDLHQAVGWMFLLFAWLIEAEKKKTNLIVPILLIILLGGLALSAHPLVIVPLVFLWGFLWIEKTNWPFTKKQSIILTAFIVLTILLKYYVSKHYSGYDVDLMTGVKTMRVADIYYALFYPMSIEILKHFRTNYWILGIIGITGIVVSLTQWKYLLTAWVIAGTLAFHIAVCRTWGWYSPFLMEGELMPFIIILSVLFVFVVMPRLKQRTVLVLLSLIFLIRLAYIGFAAAPYVERTNFLYAILDKMKAGGYNKLFLPRKTGSADPRLKIDWAISEESLVASALGGDKPQRNFIIMTYNDTWNRISHDKDVVQTAYEARKINRFNADYFTIDTTQEYTYIDFDEFVRGMK